MTKLSGMDLVSNKAKSALQAVSARAEWVISEIKADLKAVADLPGSIVRDASSPATVLPRGGGEVPWVGKSEHEKKHEEEFKRRILDISKHPEEYLLKPYDEHLLIDMRAAMASAGAILEEDGELQKLRFELVPKQMKEAEFWRRYFLAVKAIKQEILAADIGEGGGGVEERSSSSGEGGFTADAPVTSLRLDSDELEEEEYQSAYAAVAIAPSMVVRRLASAVGVARGVRTMEDLANLEESAVEPSSMQAMAVAEKWTASIKHSVRGGIGAGMAVLGSLSGRERDWNREKDLEREKEVKKGHAAGLGQYHALLWSLFDADTQYFGTDSDEASMRTQQMTHVSLIQEIHGAPPDSFVPQLAEIIAGIKSEQKMAVFWQEVVKELRRRWQQAKPIPHLPVEANPDLHTCLLNQQLQLINCCMARQKRRTEALASLAEALQEGVPPAATSAAPGPEGTNFSAAGEADLGKVNSGEALPGEGEGEEGRRIQTGEGRAKEAEGGESGVDRIRAKIAADAYSLAFTRLTDGTLVRRLGAATIVPELVLLETGEPLCAPICQEGPVLTEDLIREAEEHILRTGSSGAGCSQLFSDMQAFKAANPGCVIEDFMRWYSPLDWALDPASPAASDMVTPGSSAEAGAPLSKDSVKELEKQGARGFLSARMQTEGNLWQELWQQAKAVPAVKQAPLFDEELSAESTLDAMDAIAPSDLFEQLFIAALGAGFAIALAAPQAQGGPLSTCLQECSTYVVSTCTRGMSAGKLERLCQVYEMMETALHTPADLDDSFVKMGPPVFPHADSTVSSSSDVEPAGTPGLEQPAEPPKQDTPNGSVDGAVGGQKDSGPGEEKGRQGLEVKHEGGAEGDGPLVGEGEEGGATATFYEERILPKGVEKEGKEGTPGATATEAGWTIV